jgi:hypothetical protein
MGKMTEKCRQYFCWKTRKKDHSEVLGVDGRIMLRVHLREIGWKGVDWMHMANNNDQERVLVNMVMNFQVP